MYGKITDNLYEVRLPLEGSSLKELSVYILTGSQRNCMIDVGFATAESDRILRNAVSGLGLNPRKTDIVITHTHRDHVENLPNMCREFGQVYCSQWDAAKLTGTDWIGYESFLETLFLQCGIPHNLLSQIVMEEEIRIPAQQITVLSEGDYLDYGDFHLEVLDLCGHMPGHIGLYDAGKKLLFSGDHVLNKITPNIGFYHEQAHSLANYIKHLKQVQQLDVNLVLPAHRGAISNLPMRVDEILAHHGDRLDEITGVLFQKPMCAYEVAGKARWHYGDGDFKSYPVFMKWMATSEILAHLQYLYERGEILRYGDGKAAYIFQCRS